jgi:hypothetical protein|tara:strand:+ start:1195 stop:1422 length:228 start_codon:yes stop_codon:yes gene_type:complete
MVSPVFPGRAVGSVSLSCGLPSNFLHEVRVVIVLNRRRLSRGLFQRDAASRREKIDWYVMPLWWLSPTSHIRLLE